MKAKRVTLGDVAREAEVSVTTASFVLSGREGMRISEVTTERVRAVATRLGYRPNMTARSLRSNITLTLGMVADCIGSAPYAGDMIRGAVDQAARSSRLVIVAETEDFAADGADLVDAMLDRRVDGLIYGAMFTRRVTPPAALASVPHVFLNCLPDIQTGPSVIPDERTAGRTAAAALLDAGRTEGVYYLGGRQVTDTQPEGIYAGRERTLGIAEEFRRRGAVLAGTVESDWTPECGYEAARQVLRSAPRPRALICGNDRTAMGAYQALAEAGLAVPDDVSVVSFDDSELAGWLRPALSSVALPHHELGARAVELLVAGDLDPVLHRLPMPLAVRSSIAPR
ncbi:LacI family DNA-binding transcriptional regulator [Tsukamurella soli]|uniref:LacI family DNA-binding transcriptional regulator n=1 Tax=Tsukamurella soli TaxID=644556 RepID=A0ABP8JT56_9ACTN